MNTAKLPAAVVDVFVSPRRNIAAARTPFRRALDAHGEPDEVITDLAQALETVIEELVPDAFHNTEQYANNRVECDHGRLKARLRPMRGLKTDRTSLVVIRGQAFIQNLRRGHYELGTDTPHPHLRIVTAFTELTEQSDPPTRPMPSTNAADDRTMQQCLWKIACAETWANGRVGDLSLAET